MIIFIPNGLCYFEFATRSVLLLATLILPIVRPLSQRLQQVLLGCFFNITLMLDIGLKLKIDYLMHKIVLLYLFDRGSVCGISSQQLQNKILSSSSYILRELNPFFNIKNITIQLLLCDFYIDPLIRSKWSLFISILIIFTLPVSNSKARTPILQISKLLSWPCLLIISGARYSGVPT